MRIANCQDTAFYRPHQPCGQAGSDTVLYSILCVSFYIWGSYDILDAFWQPREIRLNVLSLTLVKKGFGDFACSKKSPCLAPGLNFGSLGIKTDEVRDKVRDKMECMRAQAAVYRNQMKQAFKIGKNDWHYRIFRGLGRFQGHRPGIIVAPGIARG